MTKKRILKADPGAYKIEGQPAGFHVEGPTAGGGRKIESNPPEGGKAVSERASDGSFRAEFSGSLPKGRSGEPHAKKVLRLALDAAGHAVRDATGASDASGEDGIFEIDGEKVAVQVVTMPMDDKLWGELARHGATERVGVLSDAVKLVRAAIEKKKFAKRCIVALDAANVGAIPGPDLVAAYLNAHGNPNTEFGFVQTWIVGPTAGSTFKIA